MSPLGIATSSSTTNSTSSNNRGTLWLLLVGVNNYQDEELPNLNYPAIDCQGLANALTNLTGEFNHKEIKIYHDLAPHSPYLANVRKSIKIIAKQAKSIDTVLFYFSGHGVVDSSSQQAFLCLSETQKSNLIDTAFGIKELLHLLANCAAQNQLVWLDACHSGGMTLRGATTETLISPTQTLVEVLQKQAARSKGFYALLSCDTNQQSWEFSELGHGVFTYYLMQGLRGEAGDSQGLICADNLYRYVYHKTLQYIDKKNQQLRLINQQKRSKGETRLFHEYTLQTPKRIVEGVGELVFGKSQSKLIGNVSRRIALVVEGISVSQTALDISKLIGKKGEFEVEYLQAAKTSPAEIRSAIKRHLQTPKTDTTLLYLQGKLEKNEAGGCLLLGEKIRLECSWLKQILRECNSKQIVILDCLKTHVEMLQRLNTDAAGSATSLQRIHDGASVQNIQNGNSVENLHGCLQEWVEILQMDSQQGQCLIGYLSPVSEPERFAQIIIKTLTNTLPTGLSAAGAIAKLQLELAGSEIPLQVWLTGTQGIIEFIPASSEGNKDKTSSALDLGFCPYMGLNAFSELDYQYFYGREALTQQLINQINKSAFLGVVGASGSGKSSVVRAGLIPALQQGKQIPNSEQWLIKYLRPGVNPLTALVQACEGFAVDFELDSQSPNLLLEGMQYLGVEGFVYWLRNRPEPMVILVVDQFEELFSLATPTETEKFLNLLLGAIEYAGDRFKLVITLRADFISSCLENPALAELLQKSSVLVPPNLTEEDYRRVITQPAQQVGLNIEPELVEVLLRELDRSAGDLPLLEFVLEQLWQNRVDGKLTLQAYQEKLGGIQGALERSCEAVYDRLDPQAKECAQWIFLSLTQLGEGTEDTRRRVFKSELIVEKYPQALVEKTLKALTDAKLIVVNLEEDQNTLGASRGSNLEAQNIKQNNKGTHHNSNVETRHNPNVETRHNPNVETRHNPNVETRHNPNVETRHNPNVETRHVASLQDMKQEITVEVAHEILIRHWSTLRWWLEENRSRLRSQRQIEQAAHLWKDNNEQDDFLLKGVRLAEAEDIYIKYTSELSLDVQRFIEACLEERKRLQQEAKNRLKKARRVAIGMTILGITACGFAGLTYWTSREAQLREIEALNFSSQAHLLLNQQLEGLITSVQAGERLKNIISVPEDIRVKTENTIQKALSIQESNRLQGHDDIVTDVIYSPKSKIIASASDDETVKLWSPDGRLLRILRGHKNAVKSISFSPDGKKIASASFDGTVKIWRTSDGILLKTLKAHSAEVLSVTWSPRGDIIASSGGARDGTVKIWQVSDGRLLKILNGHKGYHINGVAISADGQILASGSDDKTIKLWRISDGRLLNTLEHNTEVYSITFSPNGQILVSGNGDKTIKIWRRNGTFVQKISEVHNADVRSVSFSRDGKTLASSSTDGSIKLWNSNDGTLVETFKGHKDSVFSVAFGEDDQTLFSAGGDQTVRIWKRQNNLLETLRSKSGVYSVKFNPQGNLLASANEDGTIKIWQAHNGGLPKTLQGNNNADITSISFSPDGEILASGDSKGRVKLWQTHNGDMIKSLKGHKHAINSLSFSRDGNILASASGDETVKLWDVKKHSSIATLKGHKSQVLSVDFSPNANNILATASMDKTVKFWQLNITETPLRKEILRERVKVTLLKSLKKHTSQVNAVSFSPDGKTLASASSDLTIKLWKVKEGTLLKTLKGHNNSIWSINFSPNGQTIVSASDDQTVKLWSINGRELKTLKGHTDSVYDATFSPDGKIIASGSFDGTIKIWDLDSKQLQTLDLDNLLIRSCKQLDNYLKTKSKVNWELNSCINLNSG
ncbi:caspase family protein [Mastigocoleus sp. MO_188.B34]|uniref:nSTAND1 domain-containing NTPase n=1 Tax=Mastigocoleus sp. MO_188.B34 TaxID=3036635 RepID=UPI00262ABF91|nr:caspase family protein [Mastigocoleus sp. MO_188.B34]MDJ0695570.1 caspase family protein [Mastigocoleus sp. MO_188.B34]